MKKIKLNFKELTVDSFVTNSNMNNRGTLLGNSGPDCIVNVTEYDNNCGSGGGGTGGNSDNCTDVACPTNPQDCPPDTINCTINSPECPSGNQIVCTNP
ncbi:MAG: hypothetical protein ACEPO8_08510 [Rhodothermaceae bacterium]